MLPGSEAAQVVRRARQPALIISPSSRSRQQLSRSSHGGCCPRHSLAVSPRPVCPQGRAGQIKSPGQGGPTGAPTRQEERAPSSGCKPKAHPSYHRLRPKWGFLCTGLSAPAGASSRQASQALGPLAYHLYVQRAVTTQRSPEIASSATTRAGVPTLDEAVRSGRRTAAPGGMHSPAIQPVNKPSQLTRLLVGGYPRKGKELIARGRRTGIDCDGV